MHWLRVTGLLSTVFLVVGCGTNETLPVGDVRAENKAAGAVATVPPDDAAAIAALEKLGARLKRGGDGRVTEVNLRGVELTDEDLAPLVSLTNLQSVLLNDTAITDGGLPPVGAVTTLRNLDLRGCGISNDGLAHLVGLTSLRALRLSGKNNSTQVDDRGMGHIGKLIGLKALLLDFLFISEDGLEQLKGLKGLEEIYLAGTLAGDEAAGVLKQFSRLRKVRLSQTQVSDSGLEQLKDIETLVELDVSENSLISDAGMVHLGTMKNLQKLNLWRLQISDAGLEPLGRLTNLAWLNLDNTLTSDVGLPALSGLKKLEFLHLGSTAVTDEGLVHLEALTSLKDLKVTRTNVSERGVATLQKKLPGANIQLKYIAGDGN